MQDTLSQTFAALADPTRRAMLAHLSEGEANVSDLAKPFLKEHEPASGHEAPEGLGESRPDHQKPRSAMASLQTQRDAFKDVADWMEQYRIFWEESFDRLDAYLKTVTAKKKAKGKTNGHKN